MLRAENLIGNIRAGTWKQAIIARLPGPLRALLGDRLVRNVGWNGVAEFANRLTRLITTVVLARWLSAQDLGLAAIAITTFEILRIIAQTGVGQAVGRADEAELAATCNTAHRVSWMICMATLAVQLLIGAVIAWTTGRASVFFMIACLAGVYLTLPFGQIQAHLIVRQNRLHVLAKIALVQVAADNLFTALLAVAGFGPWAIVLPKLITAPIWVIGMRRAQEWKMDPAAGFAPWRPLVTFAGAIVGSDLVVASRLHFDKMIVGAMLGVEALGIYYFIFNAGIGFSLSITLSLAASMYPHLAELATKPKELLARYDQMLVRAVAPCSAVIALQAVLALLYVPLVFGPKFAPYAYLVTILCASAVTKPVYDSAAQLLRIFGLVRLELAIATAFTALSLTALAAGLTVSLPAGIIAMSVATIAVQVLFAIAVRRGLATKVNKHWVPAAAPAPDLNEPVGATP